MADRENTGAAGGNDRSRKQGDGRADEGFGDDQGTRVGRPDSAGPNAAPSTGTGVRVGEESTGAGSEAAEGIHSTKGHDPKEKSSVEHAHGEPGRGEGAGLSGSEPLRHRETEHKSGYGGEGAEPKTSSDQR